MKKITSLILILSMIFALCACGQTDSTESASGKAEATPEPEFAYKSDYSELDVGTSEYMDILCYTDTGFYATYSEVVGEEEHEGVEQEYEGQFDIYESRIIFVSYTGDVTKLSSYTPAVAMSDSDSEGKYDYDTYVYINAMSANENGLYILEGCYEYWFTKEGVTYEDADYWDYYKYRQTYYISKIDENGAKETSTAIEINDDEYLSSNIVIDSDGNFLMGGTNIRAVAPDGTVKYEITVDGYLDGIIRANDGTIYTLVYMDDGGERLYSINTSNHSLDMVCDCPQDAYNLIAGGGDYPLYYSSGVTFYGLDPETGEASKLFNWIDMDINGETISRACVLSDGKIVTTSTLYDSDSKTFSMELYNIEKVPYSSIPKKTTLTLATQSLSYDSRDAIIDFNRRNDTYHIEVIDYSEYNTDDDSSAGLTKMKTEIMAGNIPDIIDMTGLSLSQFASKGILEDLYPYIDRDLDRSDYFENVLEACEVNGKLYTTIPGFSITTVIGASSIVGDTPGWTYDELEEALAMMPEGCTPFDEYTTRDSILYTCLGLDMSDFVNWETGEVNFNCEEFIDLLEFANSFPETFDWENYDYTDEKSTSEKIASGEQMLEMTSIYSVGDVLYNNTDFGVDTTYIGYPTNNGTGNMINVDSGFAMTSSCQNKDVVWEFLKTYFEEDYQKSLYNFPLIKSLFEKELTEAMTPEYKTDSSGNYLVDENGDRIMVPKLELYDSDGTIQQYYCLSEEQGNSIRELVETTTKMYTYDESISSIVQEEAQAYFSGQKTAEEVAKLIQSKVSIYVNEQR